MGIIHIQGPAIGTPGWYRHWERKTKDEIIRELHRACEFSDQRQERAGKLEAERDEAVEMLRQFVKLSDTGRGVFPTMIADARAVVEKPKTV